MAKKRVYEMAKELGLSNKEVVDKLQALGFDVKSHSSSLEDVEADAAMSRIRGETAEPEAPKKVAAPAGVVRRRRKKTAGDTEVVTETRIVPGAPQAQEEVVRTTEQPVAPEPEEVPAEVAAEGIEAEAAAEGEAAGVEAAAEGETPAVAAEGESQAAASAEAGTNGGAAAKSDPNLPAVNEGEVVSVEDRLKEPTATQAVVISRPLIPVAPKVPPAPRTAGGPGRRIGPVKEYQVVSDALGRGREFVDVTKDKGKRKTPGGERRAKEAFSKRELMTMARSRAFVPMRGRKRRPTKKGKKTEVTQAAAHKRIIRVEETIQVAELAKGMGVRLTDVIRKLMQLGAPATANQSIDVETAQLVADEFEYTVVKTGIELEDILETAPEGEEIEGGESRPAVVTVMGHVDHGKTSLLDYIRKSRVASGEAGGITQHIGAYSVPVGEGSITFLDTPGHEAFTAMRARGAQVTDVVILVVAADDSIMPQTVEAINHAKEAGVPLVVAVNKCDLPQANPERVRQGLTEHGLVPEEWGGDVMVVDVSAKSGEGVDKLLDAVNLQAEVLELKANPEAPAQGVVIEAKVEKGRGPVASVLVKNGTLHKGDVIFTGTHYGKIRALLDDTGKPIKDVGPGLPAEVLGLDGVPSAGDKFYTAKDEKAARELAAKNAEKAHVEGLGGDAALDKRMSLEQLFSAMKESEQKELKLIVKADVQGSTEAVIGALTKLTTEKVKVTVIHQGVGAISESDVMLAAASGAVIVGFNVKPDGKARKTADHEGVDVRAYSVIYDAVDDVKAAMIGLLPPIRKEQSVGHAEVREVFRVSGKGTIAGCAVVDGKVQRSAHIRVLRDKASVFEGRIDGLKRFKEDVREVPTGMECGVSIAGFNDVKAGDVLEVFDIEEVRPTL